MTIHPGPVPMGSVETAGKPSQASASSALLPGRGSQVDCLRATPDCAHG